MRDPVRDHYEGRLEPWQKSNRRFDFDPGFVRHIVRYLRDRELPHETVDAMAWINKARFDEERNDLCHLQWMQYQIDQEPRERPALPTDNWPAGSPCPPEISESIRNLLKGKTP